MPQEMHFRNTSFFHRDGHNAGNSAQDCLLTRNDPPSRHSSANSVLTRVFELFIGDTPQNPVLAD